MTILSALQIFFRGARLRCPACGDGSLYRSLFRMRKSCSSCGLVFEREPGYFVGAIYINVIATELLLAFCYFAYYLAMPITDDRIDKVMVVLALLLPAVFYHHARSLWLSFNHVIEPSRPVIFNQ
jgi:uncharacterized protein (DUF983 family)